MRCWRCVQRPSLYRERQAQTAAVKVDVRSSTELVFDDGSPVRAASAIAPFGDGWLIAQDDETVGAWWRDRSVTPVRFFPPVEGHDRFSEDDGTKELKPDLEAACSVPAGGGHAALLLGSGSLPRRMRAALATPEQPHCSVMTADLTALYHRMAGALELDIEDLNLEGACVLGTSLRWFQRGHDGSDVPSSSVDVGLVELLAAVTEAADPADVPLGRVRRYEFVASGDVSLAVTDAAVLTDGRILISLAAEDAPDAVADGEIVGAALAVIDDEDVVSLAQLPAGDEGGVRKVEGLAIRDAADGRLDVVAVVDQDDPDTPSLALSLDVQP